MRGEKISNKQRRTEWLRKAEKRNFVPRAPQLLRKPPLISSFSRDLSVFSSSA
jgi:hypothetical protein